MDPSVLKALEFPQILERLREEAVTPPGRALADRLRPSGDLTMVQAENDSTVEAGRFLMRHGHLPFGIVPDPDPPIARLEVDGAVLAPLEVLDLIALLKAGREIKSALTGPRAEFPLLWLEVRGLPDLGNLIRFLDGKISASGELEDHASDDLRLVRQDLKRRNERLKVILDAIVGRPEVARSLQEDFVSIRSERHVIPIRSESRGALPGIVHGVSGSGATVFVEPLETVELNNEIVTLKEQEAEEVRRLLREYTALLRSRLPEIKTAWGVIGRLDLLTARARLGTRMNAIPAAVSDTGELTLEEARHPLVEESLRAQGGRIVPLDLALVPEARVLVISGPNTGGKTVALKTAGLLSLMFQSGLLVPARRAVLPVFRCIDIDIGDRQSISDGLSTFSARMKTIAEIAAHLEPPALALLDEIGTGTDPEDGVALAIAIVDHFRQRGATVIATTHLEHLKAYAAQTPGCANAAMQFDESGSCPTFRLRPGVPGRSGALEIAERLGLPAAILEVARARRGVEGRLISDYLRRLEEMSASLAARLHSVSEERARLDRDRKDLAAASREREERQRQAVAAEIELTLGALRQAGERYLSSLKDREVEIRMRRDEARAAADLRAEARRLSSQVSGRTAPSADSRPAIRKGMAVRIDGIETQGVVDRIQGDRIVVLVRGKRLTISRGDCRPTATSRAPEDEPVPGLPRGVTLGRRPHGESSGELHLRGRSVEDALALVDKYLDDAYLASLSPVRLVHGVGSGRLKRAIADLLSRHPHVEAFERAPEDDGGQGVTIVRLRL